MHDNVIAKGIKDSFLELITWGVAKRTAHDPTYVAGALNIDADGNLTASGDDITRAAKREILARWKR